MCMYVLACVLSLHMIFFRVFECVSLLIAIDFWWCFNFGITQAFRFSFHSPPFFV